MIKTKNDGDEVVTKDWFREAMRDAIGEFAMIVNKSFVGVESRIEKLEERMDARFEKIESTMTGMKDDILWLKNNILALTQRVDKLEKYIDKRFDSIVSELKEIRKEIKSADTRADVFDLRSRVTKLEQKAGL